MDPTVSSISGTGPTTNLAPASGSDANLDPNAVTSTAVQAAASNGGGSDPSQSLDATIQSIF